MNDIIAGTYKLDNGKHGSVIVRINYWSVVEYCDDAEQLEGTPAPHAPHRGAKAQYFERGAFGQLKANSQFFIEARKVG